MVESRLKTESSGRVYNMVLVFHEIVIPLNLGKLSESSSVQRPWTDCLKMWQPFPGLLRGMLKHSASNSLVSLDVG